MAVYATWPPLPSWPCRPSGLPFPTIVFSKLALQLLPETLFLVVLSSKFQHPSVVLLVVVFFVFLRYLLGVLLVVTALPRLAACLPFKAHVPVTAFLAFHFLPIVGLF